MSTRPINIYAELTPNPNSLKFVADVMLLEGGTIEYCNKEEAHNCPLAVGLFDFTSITRVFIASNFITVTKEEGLDWYEITNIIREYIRGFLMSGDALFIKPPTEIVPNKPSKETVAKSEPTIETPSNIVIENQQEVEEKIISLLDEYVRPAVEGDGGAIHFQSFNNGVVKVVLKGACSGCPSSTITLKSGIENLLKRMVPGVEEVVAVEG